MKIAESLKSSFRIYRGLKRSIYVLFLARIINSIGSFVYPFLTLFLTDKLGNSAAEAGMLLMMVSISFVPGSLIGGKIADTFGRKRILIGAQFLAALSFLTCALITDKQLIPYFIIAAEFFMGVVHPTTTAMITDLSKPENRKAAFSLLYLGHNLGFALGPLLAGLMYNSRPYWLFSGDAATTLISLILVILFVTETKPSVQRLNESIEDGGGSPELEKAEKGSVFRVLAARPGLVFFILLVMLMNFVYAQMTFSLPLFLNDIFGPEGAVLYGTTMTFNALIVILGTTLIIGLTKNMKPILATMIAALLYAVGFGGIYFGYNFYIILSTASIWTVGEILGATNINVYIANHTPMSHRGRVNSIVPIIIGAGHAISPFLMGKFIENNSLRLVWPLCALFALAASGGLAVLYTVEKRKNG
ncbi:MAG: MFS transporter [Spirochaetales bacterium]|uniref:MFS transporter n=1 Tax=Candidatus Thalassospirochaeta sargassi TaxID=3119039 RepID=A0AAJ1IDK3_9SPIO|nr:MFS transporter [Spirochaetales bacterium]